MDSRGKAQCVEWYMYIVDTVYIWSMGWGGGEEEGVEIVMKHSE